MSIDAPRQAPRYIVHSITRTDGIGGQFVLTADVEIVLVHNDTPFRTKAHFVGSIYGGPIVVATDDIPQGLVVSAAVRDRCGDTLTEAFVRHFYNV